MTIETANRLYELRKKHNLSQEELAEKLGVSRQAVSKWERSEASPDTDNLIALAKIYKLSLDELIYGERAESAESPCEEIGEGSEDDVSDAEAPEGIDEVDEEGAFVVEGKLVLDKPDVKSTKFWLEVPYPIICTILYLIFGCCDILGGWHPSWIIFATIPVYYSLVGAIYNKRVSEFAYPVLTAVVYLVLGCYFNNWHPSWIIFITIPVYYSIASAIDKRIKRSE